MPIVPSPIVVLLRNAIKKKKIPPRARRTYTTPRIYLTVADFDLYTHTRTNAFTISYNNNNNNNIQIDVPSNLRRIS